MIKGKIKMSTNIKILKTEGLNSAISDMIANKEETHLLLITPYIDLKDNKKIIKSLKHSNAKIQIVIRKEWRENKKKKYDENLKNLKKEFSKIDFVETENLHAKVYLSPSKIILTSMNLYWYSQTNNFELGVILDYDKDDKMCQDIVREIKSFLIDNDKNESVKLLNELYANRCIICKEIIENEDHQYCKKCYGKKLGEKNGKT
jgi:hypothetical protein